MLFYSLETSRLQLKGIPYDTMHSIFETLGRDDVMKLLGHLSLADFEKELEKHKLGYSSYNRRFVMFLLIDKESNKIIGRCGLHNWNEEHHRAEIGYVMQAEEFKRKGLMSEAVDAILNFGFFELKLNRIDAMVGSGNLASLRIIERFGFVKEGVLRQHVCINGVFEDSILFSKLVSEHQLKM